VPEDPKIVVVTEERTSVVETVSRGPQGPAGPEGSGRPFEFIQNAPATDWIVLHNLGRRPVSVMVYDSADTILFAGITYDNDNQITVSFTAPISGRVEVL
jgi:hypothetical protein